MEFNELIVKRRSIRVYEPADIPTETLLQLAEAARMAPSWKNSQTARVYLAVSPEAKEAVSKALPSFNQVRSKDCAAYLVTGFVKGDSGYINGAPANEAGECWGAYDLGLHDAYMLLKAADLGLDSLIMGLRHADVLRAALSIPEDVQIMSVIAVGKRGGDPVMNERKPVTETVKVL